LPTRAVLTDESEYDAYEADERAALAEPVGDPDGPHRPDRPAPRRRYSSTPADLWTGAPSAPTNDPGRPEVEL
jgi:hypothetical protein